MEKTGTVTHSTPFKKHFLWVGYCVGTWQVRGEGSQSQLALGFLLSTLPSSLWGATSTVLSFGTLSLFEPQLQHLWNGDINTYASSSHTLRWLYHTLSSLLKLQHLLTTIALSWWPCSLFYWENKSNQKKNFTLLHLKLTDLLSHKSIWMHRPSFYPLHVWFGANSFLSAQGPCSWNCHFTLLLSSVFFPHSTGSSSSVHK